MKIERAIKLLDNSIGYEYSPEYDEALEMAIQVLNKQKPMKLEDDNPQWTHSCGSCSEELKIWMNYCPECGQKIDWGEYRIEKYGIEKAKLAIKALQTYHLKPDCESAEKCGDKCCGYGKSEYDDEPIDACNGCDKQVSYGED